MKKQLTVIFLVLSVILNIMLGAYIYYSNQGLSDEDIKKKFDCDRVTLDIRETDIFCRNPDVYRQAVE